MEHEITSKSVRCGVSGVRAVDVVSDDGPSGHCRAYANQGVSTPKQLRGDLRSGMGRRESRYDKGPKIRGNKV